MSKGVINIQIDQGYIKQVVKDTINTALERDLSGVTWSLEEFRKECCGGAKRHVGLPTTFLRTLKMKLITAMVVGSFQPRAEGRNISSLLSKLRNG